MNIVTSAAGWLHSNHIHVPDDWLQACVEWITQENQDQGLSEEAVRSQVYEQWLLSDLHELETCCLPDEVTTADKLQLDGTYALQVDSILDVGVSFYSQSQKVQGKENANIHVTADEPTQKPWEQKPSRMLLMRLTDGRHSVQGMEYQPIKCLSQQTPPGTKLIVHGSVLCRHGMLMLREDNIKFLGGEVDTLLEANSIVNVLQSAMESNTENANKEHRTTYPPSAVRKSKAPSKMSGHGQMAIFQGHSNQAGATGNQSGQARTFVNQSMGKVKMEVKTSQPVNQSRTMKSRGSNDVGNQTAQSKVETDYSDYYDAIMDDLDDDFIREVDVKMDQSSMPWQQGHEPTSNHARNALPNGSSINKDEPQRTTDVNVHTGAYNQSTTITTVPARSSFQDSMDFDDDDFDDDFPPMDDELMNVPTNQVSVNCGVGSGQIGSKKQINTCTIQSSTIGINVNARKSHLTSSVMNTDQTDNKQQAGGNEHVECGSSVKMTTNVFTDKNIRSRSTSDSTANVSKANIAKTKSLQQNQNQGQTAFCQRQALGSVCQNISEEIVDGVKIKESSSQVQCVSDEMGFKMSSTRSESTATAGSSRESLEKILKIKKEQEESIQSSPGPDIETEYPFTYLSTVLSQSVTEVPSYHTVKAYISTLTSKLTSTNNLWSLSCKINDGTRAVEVDISSKVLTEMIGFSPTEANEMKLRIKTDPKIKEFLTEGIQQCQQRLIELMCLLELEISPHKPRPVIVATKQLTANHIALLHTRVLTRMVR